MFGDRFAKGLAFHGISQGHVGRAFGHAGAARRNVDPAQFQTTCHLLEAPTFFASDQMGGRDPEVVKNQFGTVDGAVAKLLEFLPH